MSSIKQVLVCQNSACCKQGASKVLAAFEAHSVPGVMVTGNRCLGQCGNGPMVLVLPEEIWYSCVQPDEVPAVVERHLRQGKPITAMYHQFRPR